MQKVSSKPTAWDLFAGCGGLTTGLKTAGFNVVAAVEIDAKARETYAMNHPEVWLAGADIKTVDPVAMLQRLGLKKGGLDLLAGCPPCQGFSRIRRRNGVRASRDPRNALVDSFFRFAAAVCPKLIMMENVPGLERHYRFKHLVTGLKELGYRVGVEILDVADYEVAQRRRRLIIVASRIGKPELAQPMAERRTVRQTIGRLVQPGRSRDGLHNIPETRSARIREIISAIPKDGGSRSQLPKRLKLQCHLKTNGFGDVYGRMAWDSLSPTITGGCHNPSKGRFLHPEQNRTISLREAALLQGFPKNYRFKVCHGKEALALMIGNALPPPFIKAHALALRAVLRSSVAMPRD